MFIFLIFSSELIILISQILKDRNNTFNAIVRDN